MHFKTSAQIAKPRLLVVGKGKNLHVMTKSVREQAEGCAGLDDLLYSAIVENAELQQPLNEDMVCQNKKVAIEHPWSNLGDARVLHLLDETVYGLCFR
jgi:hypothetical protein